MFDLQLYFIYIKQLLLIKSEPKTIFFRLYTRFTRHPQETSSDFTIHLWWRRLYKCESSLTGKVNRYNLMYVYFFSFYFFFFYFLGALFFRVAAC